MTTECRYAPEATEFGLGVAVATPRLEEHLDGCAECRQAATTARSNTKLLAGPMSFQAPPRIRSHVLAHVGGPRHAQRSAWRSKARLGGIAAGLATAALTITVVVPAVASVLSSGPSFSFVSQPVPSSGVIPIAQ